MRDRLKLLLAHDINLWAYHLPLDAHPEWGNNAQLGRVLGFQVAGWFGEQSIACLGTVQPGYANAQQLADHVAERLGRAVTCIDPAGRPVHRVAWCTGGAQGYFEEAIAAGVDAFLTGEISEPQMHYAREMGVAFLACGHHATERYGAPAVAAHVAAAVGVQHHFIDIDNPA
jgi:dinuclear metal center YbgI/SA1388 family protein